MTMFTPPAEQMYVCDFCSGTQCDTPQVLRTAGWISRTVECSTDPLVLCKDCEAGAKAKHKAAQAA